MADEKLTCSRQLSLEEHKFDKLLIAFESQNKMLSLVCFYLES